MCQKYKLQIAWFGFLSCIVERLCGCYIHEKDYAQYDLCDTGMCARERINMFFVCQVSGLVKTFNIGIYFDTMNVINVKLGMMVLLIELYLFIPLSVTLTIIHGHSNIKQF